MRKRLSALALTIRLSIEADRRLTYAMVFALVLALGSMLGVALALKLLVDATVTRDVGRGLVGAGAAGVSLAAAVVWLPLATTVSLTLQERIGALVDQRLMTYSSQAETLELHDRPEFVEKLTMLMQHDRHDLNNAMTTVAALASFAAMLATSGVVLGLQHPLLALLPLCCVPPLWLGLHADAQYERWWASTVDAQRLAEDVVKIATSPPAGKELRVFGLADNLLARHDAAYDAITAGFFQASLRAMVLRGTAWLLFTAAWSGAVFTVVVRAVEGDATSGDVIIVISLAVPLVFVAGQIPRFATWLVKTLLAAERLQWLADASVRTPAARPSPAPNRLHDGIRFEAVTFAYPGTGAHALVDVHLCLPAGTVVAIVGENGAGKSTLAKLLLGLYRPTAGRITVDGVDLADIDTDAWRSRIAAGFQDFCSFELLLRESVGVGDLPRIDDEQAIMTAVSRGGATDVVDAVPGGLYTQLGRSWPDGVDLSSGQWQKVALARALNRDDPLLVVLDEPTAALDPGAEHALFERLASAARAHSTRGAITVLVSHRFSTVDMADLIVVVVGGRPLEIGTHKELLQRSATYAELYELQAASYR